MVTRIARMDSFGGKTEPSTQPTTLPSQALEAEHVVHPHQDDYLERSIGMIDQEKFPVSRQESIGWQLSDKSLYKLKTLIAGLVGATAGEKLNLDQYASLSRESILKALKGVNLACKAVDDILSGNTKRVICAQRPQSKGQQTTTEQDHLGFTIFSNAALAAYYALSKNMIGKAAIIDFDSNHGTGTRELIRNNKDIMLVTVNAGSNRSILSWNDGADKTAKDTNQIVNIPKICHADDMERIFEEDILSPIRDFKPDILFFSIRPEKEHAQWPQALSYDYINQKVQNIAAETTKGRIVLVLEGEIDQKFLETFSKQPDH